jgi:hypothetical protein
VLDDVASNARQALPHGEYVGVGIGLCLLLLFSYVVQYLTRHGYLVPPTRHD